MDESTFYRDAFSRNIGLLTEEQQERLRQMTIVIAGLGGGGGIYANTFARLGFGRFRIADYDTFQLVNMNRQAAATMQAIGRPKTEVVEEMIHSINPYAEVEVFKDGLTPENSDSFLQGADIVIDAIDFFSIQARRLLYAKAREKGLFVVSAGPIGFGSSVLVFDPKGMSFDDYFDIHDGLSEQEMYLRFGLGVTPSLLQRRYFRPDAVNWKEKKAPSLISGVLLCANLVSTEVLRILFQEKTYAVPHSLHFDPYVRALKKTYMPFGNRNPWQRLKLFVVKQVLKSKGRL